MIKNINNYGKFIYFLNINSKGKYIKNLIFQELNEKNINNCIMYFEIIENGDVSLNFCKRLEYNVSYHEFPYESYLHLNTDLSGEKEHLWYHWQNYGIKEERTYTCINNSSLHQGRLGNLFFINMFLHFISIKYDLKCYYKNYRLFNHLGIYFNKGEKEYKTNCLITDDNFLYILKNKYLEPSNVIVENVWFHKREFCSILKLYFDNDKIKTRIIDKNIFKDRYNNNNDLFIHVRLGDVTEITKTQIYYYDKLLSTIKYNNGFISSDCINHELCLELIVKYKLEVIYYDEVKTIMFASTCKNIILSGGTFSWLIGFFAFYSSQIFYPDIKNKWYGDIFSIFNWNQIKIS
jgi:hypothetical protein